jgi:hypothetical protein
MPHANGNEQAQLEPVLHPYSEKLVQNVLNAYPQLTRKVAIENNQCA